MPRTAQGHRTPSRQVAAALRAAIESGELGPGDKLPSERDLAATHQIARNTAREAVRQLSEAGLVDAQHGRGVFVRARPREVPYACTIAELDALPQLSVVQFRGSGLGTNPDLVWQLDGEWFSPGSTASVPSPNFPPEAFPALILWRPAP